MLPGFSAGRALLNCLDKATPQLLLVLALVLVCFLAFAAYGISSFQHTLSRRCVYFERRVPACASSDFGPWVPPCDPRRWWKQVTDSRITPALEGEFPFEKACTVYPTSQAPASAQLPVDSNGNHHTCQVAEFRAGRPVTQMCVNGANPGNGFAHFDHFGGAFLTVFTCAVLPESAGLLHVALDSGEGENVGAKSVVYLFFLVIALLCSYFLFGLLVVVVSGTYNAAACLGGFAHDEVSVTSSDSDSKEVGDTRNGRREQFKVFVSLIIFLQATATGVAEGHLWEPMYVFHCVCTGVCAIEVLLRLTEMHVKCLGVRYLIECIGIIIGLVGLGLRKRIFVAAPAILRVYRLLRYFPTQHHLITNTVVASRGLVQLLLLLLFFVISAAVTGRYLVNATMKGRDHFATLPHSLRTAFILFSGDNWAMILFDAMASKTTAMGQGMVAAFFFLWVGFSVCILFNLAVAVILDNFSISEMSQVLAAPGVKSSARQMIKRSWAKFYKLQVEFSPRKRLNQIAPDSVGNDQGFGVEDGREVSGGEEARKAAPLLHAMDVLIRRQGVDKRQRRKPRNEESIEQRQNGESVHGEESVLDDGSSHQIPQEEQQSVFMSHDQSLKLLSDEEWLELQEDDRAYFLFSSQNRGRKMCVYVYTSHAFKMLVVSAVLTSCSLVAIIPIDPHSPSPIPVHVGVILNRACSVVFTLEFVLKSIGKKFLIGPRAYLKSGWNRLDFAILTLDLANIIGALSNNSWGFAAARAAKALSAMRAIPRNEGIRLLMEALLSTLEPVGHVMVFQLFNILLWALLAKELFGGRMHRCSGPGAEYPAGKALCSGNFVSIAEEARELPRDVLLMPRAWIRPQIHFDDLYNAFLAMLSCGAVQWVDILHDSSDITEQHVSPVHDANWQAAIFLAIWLMLGHFLINNLFLAFIVEGFKANDGLTEGDAQTHRFVRQVCLCAGSCVCERVGALDEHVKP